MQSRDSNDGLVVGKHRASLNASKLYRGQKLKDWGLERADKQVENNVIDGRLDEVILGHAYMGWISSMMR